MPPESVHRGQLFFAVSVWPPELAWEACVPPTQIINAGPRRIVSRTPGVGGPVVCYLCGPSGPDKQSLIRYHVGRCHLLSLDELSDMPIEEGYRKPLLHLDHIPGPFASHE